MSQEQTLILEEGKRYRLRNGLVTTPTQIVNYAGNYKFEAKFEEFKGRKLTVGNWLQGGHYLVRDKEHPHDIVEELN